MNNDEIKTVIIVAVCQYLPSAAIATGLVSPVDTTAFVRQMCERFPYGTRPEELGCSKLKAWLKDRGYDLGESVVMKIRHEWIMDELRVVSQTYPVSMK